MVLVDTTVWIEAFRRPPRLELTAIVDIDDIVTCLPVYQEVLQGFRDEHAFRVAREAMSSLPMIESPLPMERFDEASQIYRNGRRAGLTIGSTIDCLIAACVLQHNLEVLHIDRDFDAIARVAPLQVRSAR